MVRYGTVLSKDSCNTVLYAVVWYAACRTSLVQYRTVRYRYGMVRSNARTVSYRTGAGTVDCSTVPTAVPYGICRYGTVRYGKVEFTVRRKQTDVQIFRRL